MLSSPINKSAGFQGTFQAPWNPADLLITTYDSYFDRAWNEVMVAEIPLCSWMRRPQLPDTKELPVTVAIQPDGSDAPVSQALAARVVPTTLKSMLYEVPAVAANGTAFNVVYAPFTFF